MELTLTPEVEALLKVELDSGKFESPNEIIATALHVLSDSRKIDLSLLDAQIKEGIDDCDRGNVYTEEEAREYLKAMRAQSTTQSPDLKYLD